LSANANVIGTSVTGIQTALSSVIQSASLSVASFNPLTTPFVPNYIGYDFVLDNSVVPPANPTSVTPIPSFVPTTNSQVASLAQAVTDVQTLMAAITAGYTSTPSASYLQTYLDSTYLDNGFTGAGPGAAQLATLPVGSEISFAGVAPYPGNASATATPSTGPSVVYDGNNCVTSLWVNVAFNGSVQENTLMKHSVATPGVCGSGTWVMAGNQRQHHSRIFSLLTKIAPLGAAPGQTIYRTGLFFDTRTSDLGYTTVEITGPGITTLAAPGATTDGTVVLTHGDARLTLYNSINDTYYGSNSLNPFYSGAIEGSAAIQDCAAMTVGVLGNGAGWGIAPTSATPCVNLSQVVAGANYVISFKDGNGNILETDQQRLEVAPYPLPASLYPVLVGVSPAGSGLTNAGGTETLSWTLPTGVKAVKMSLNINNSNFTTLRNLDQYVGANATSAVFTIPPNSLPGSAVPVANSSYASIITSVGGILVQTAAAY
jgi:hypothetical protein